MGPAVGAFLGLLAMWGAAPQTGPSEFTNAAALLNAVAKSYAADADTFRMESITESVRNQEMQRTWEKSVHTVLKAPGNRFRIEARSWGGTWMQGSDGTTEWSYVPEAKAYVKRPAGDGPQFPKTTYGMGMMALRQTWEMRITLGQEAERAKNATMLPEETIVVERQRYPCYVVHATREGEGWQEEETFWIEKKTLMFRKTVEHQGSFLSVNPILKIPFHADVTTLYPVADLHPQIDPKLFVFTPPVDAKEVATLEPNLQGITMPPAPTVVGKLLPDVSLTGADGRETTLSSFRGRPLLIDVWATWCGPCLAWMPSLGRLEKEMRGKGLQVVSIDRDETAETATRYLSLHEFGWPNYHDGEGRLSKALGDRRIPLTLLVDAQGRIAYAGIGGEDEAALRKAIADLVSEATAARR
jgi:thiol-disulfide isomerase/thioredoxin/outer membrane lipoprotein-sorting protein